MQWGLITCPTCKNWREVKSVAQINPFRSPRTSIIYHQKPIRSPNNSTWLLSWSAFFPCHPWPWCSSSGPAGSLQSLQKTLHKCDPSNPRGSDVMGGLGGMFFRQKSDVWIWALRLFLAKQSSESRVHQSLTRSNLFNLASEILIRPVCILWNSLKNQVK